MPHSFPQIVKSLSMAMVLLLGAQVQMARAYSTVEGRIGAAGKSNGFFDLRVEIWNRATPVPQLVQVIDIPRVLVNEGQFNVRVETGIKPEVAKDYTLTVHSRVFESWKPYRPAELSKIQST